MTTTNEAWMEQVRQWCVKYGDTGRVTKYSGFPLRPGGAQPGSSECYKCGKTGHTRAACITPLENCIPEKEAIFRSICGSILRGTRQPNAAVNHVSTAESDNTWLWKESTHQGNGEGRRHRGGAGGPNSKRKRERNRRCNNRSREEPSGSRRVD